MNEITNVILRTIFILILIFFLFKLMGKKQVSQMSMFDYIVGITIGSVVADISLDIDKNITSGIVCLLIYCIVDILVSYLSLKSVKLRNFFEGKEVQLIIDGKINRENMAKNKLTINILQTEARLMGYFNLEELLYVILQTNGTMTVVNRAPFTPLTANDLNLQKEPSTLPMIIVSKGKVIDENLKVAGIDEKFIKLFKTFSLSTGKT